MSERGKAYVHKKCLVVATSLMTIMTTTVIIMSIMKANQTLGKNNSVTSESRDTEAVKACCSGIAEVRTILVRALPAGGVVLAW